MGNKTWQKKTVSYELLKRFEQGSKIPSLNNSKKWTNKDAPSLRETCRSSTK